MRRAYRREAHPHPNRNSSPHEKGQWNGTVASTEGRVMRETENRGRAVASVNQQAFGDSEGSVGLEVGFFFLELA